MKLNPKKKLQQLNDTEIKKALRWVKGLKKEEMTKFNQLARVQLAQVLLEAYLKFLKVKSKINSRKNQKY